MIRAFFTRLAPALAAAVAVVALGLPAQAQTAPTRPDAPDKLVFSILSAEGQASSGPLWTPLLDDLERELGIPVEPIFGSNYSVLVEAMSADQTQIGWFSALPAVQAIDRAGAEVIARTVDVDGKDSYTSTLIVRRGSGITIADIERCDRTLDFGLGDAQSTSGTLAPMTYFFSPRGIDPRPLPGQCGMIPHRSGDPAPEIRRGKGGRDARDCALCLRGGGRRGGRVFLRHDGEAAP